MLNAEITAEGFVFTGPATSAPATHEDVEHFLVTYRRSLFLWIHECSPFDTVRVIQKYGSFHKWGLAVRAYLCAFIPIILLPGTTINAELISADGLFRKSIYVWLARFKQHYRIASRRGRCLIYHKQPDRSFESNLWRAVWAPELQSVERLKRITERGFESFKAILNLDILPHERVHKIICGKPALDDNQVVSILSWYDDILDGYDSEDNPVETRAGMRLFGCGFYNDLLDVEKDLLIHSFMVGWSSTHSSFYDNTLVGQSVDQIRIWGEQWR
nr:P0 protein [Wheat leaf yellowing-associated virus]